MLSCLAVACIEEEVGILIPNCIVSPEFNCITQFPAIGKGEFAVFTEPQNCTLSNANVPQVVADQPAVVEDEGKFIDG